VAEEEEAAGRFIGQVEGMNPLRLVDPAYRTDNRTRLSAEAATADRVLEQPGRMGDPPRSG
jgi:hypothetical protein